MGGKSGQVSTTGVIPPELKPLATATTSNILKYASQNPLGPYADRYPQPIAPLSFEQRLGLGQVPGLVGADPLEALALRDVMNLPAYAGAGPTTGTPNLTGSPTLQNYYDLLGGNGLDPTQPFDPNAQFADFGPAPGEGGGSTPPHQPPRDNNPPEQTSTTGTPPAASATYQQAAGLDGGAAVTGGPTADGSTSGRQPPILPNPGGGNPPAPNFAGLQTYNPGLTGGMTIGNSPGVQAAYKQVTGADIIDNPAVAQALKSFTETVQPGILNQSTRMGLGRSDSANRAVSTAQGQMLVPLYMDAFARENERLARGYGATEEELGRRERSATRVADAMQTRAGALAGLAGQRFGEKTGAIGTAMDAGNVSRDVTQQAGDAAWNDFLRRQGLSEQATFGPWATLAGGALGTRSVSKGK